MAEAFRLLGYAFTGILNLFDTDIPSWGISLLDIAFFCILIVVIDRMLLKPMFGRYGSGGHQSESKNAKKLKNVHTDKD